MPCPHCQGTDCRYSHRRLWERLISRWTPWRPFRCRTCRRRFWGSTRPRDGAGFALSRHLGWILPLALVFAVVAVYIATLPYDREVQGRGGEERTGEESAVERPVEGSPPAAPPGRRLQALELTEVEGGVRLRVSGTGPLEPSALRHFQVPDRLVLDLPGPWTRPAPNTDHLAHPLLDRVRLVEMGRDLRLELLLRETEVEATLEETAEGVWITVRRATGAAQ